MANGLVLITGRVVSVLLCIAQSIILAHYPIIYKKNDYYGFLVIFCIPVIVALLIWYKKGCYLRHVWRVWLPHIICLIITAGVAFGWVVHELSDDRHFGPHVFEMSLCISPVLLFLLLNVASDSKKDRGLAILISFRITLDLFDGIGMLSVTLHKAGNPPDGALQEMEIVIYILVLLVFLLSSFEVREQTSDDHGKQTCSYGIRAFFHLVVNGAFLIMRLILWQMFEWPAPMFIAKSAVSLMVCVIELVECCCGFEEL